MWMAPGVPRGDRGTETVWGLRTALPMPALTVHEQHPGAGSQVHKETNYGQSGVPIGGWRAEHDRRIRSNEHHPEGTDPLAAEGRHRWSGAVHRADLRHRRLTFTVRSFGTLRVRAPLRTSSQP